MNQPVIPPSVPFSIDIDGEKVNKMVADAILTSVIGEELKKAITEAVSKTLKPDSWGRGPLVDVVNAHIRREIEALVQAEFSGPIREMVKKAITDQMTEELITKMVLSLWKSAN
jgi:hypothetical protein